MWMTNLFQKGVGIVQHSSCAILRKTGCFSGALQKFLVVDVLRLHRDVPHIGTSG